MLLSVCAFRAFTRGQHANPRTRIGVFDLCSLFSRVLDSGSPVQKHEGDDTMNCIL